MSDCEHIWTYFDRVDGRYLWKCSKCGTTTTDPASN